MNYWHLMDDEHFLATQVPQTPLEVEAFCRLEALSLDRCEDLQIAEQFAEKLQEEVNDLKEELEEVNDLKEELEEVKKDRDAYWDDLQAAENRVDDLEIACREMFEAYDNLGSFADEFTNLRNLLKGGSK